GEDGVIGTADDTTTTTTTDETGFYQFTNLNPGEEYQVNFETPDGYFLSNNDVGNDDTVDSDADSNGDSPIVTLSSGEHNPTIDAGIYQNAGLGNYVWEDSNGDGVQNDGETAISGVSVNLIDGEGNVIDSTTTDENGLYSFTNLTPGDYQVQFIAPDGYEFTSPNVGDDTTDSDVVDGFTQVVTLTSGEFNDTLDAGLLRKASLGDYVWLDENANGIQEEGENGVEGVTLTLTGGGEDGVIGTADDTTTTTTTDETGFYQFTNLNPGEEYQVNFETPDGYFLSNQDAANDDTVDSDADSNGDSPIVTLSSGEHNPTIDAGVYQPVGLGDRVWLDSNGNGIQDDGEQGVEGVTVTLVNNLFQTIATTITDSNGNYIFEDLLPGSYQVRFAKPQDYIFTQQNKGSNDGLDSDVNANGESQIVTLLAGDIDLTIDAGLVETASLGDYVWLDTNEDGVQDATEVGVENLIVTLIGGGQDAIIGTSDDTTAITQTAADGSYQFTDLTPGVEYQVNFDLPEGYSFTTQDAGTDDTLDSDVDVTTGNTQIVILASGENNPTLDAGLIENSTEVAEINIVKKAGTAADGSTFVIKEASQVTYTYEVTTGAGTLSLENIVINDDNATPDDLSDDFIADAVLSGGFNIGDSDQNNQLDPGEIWQYQSTVQVDSPQIGDIYAYASQEIKNLTITSTQSLDFGTNTSSGSSVRGNGGGQITDGFDPRESYTSTANNVGLGDNTGFFVGDTTDSQKTQVDDDYGRGDVQLTEIDGSAIDNSTTLTNLLFSSGINTATVAESYLDWGTTIPIGNGYVTDEASGNGEFNITSNTFSVVAPTTFTFNYDYLNRLITEVEPTTPDDAPLGNQAQARIDFTIIVNRLFVPQLGINSPRAAVFSSNPIDTNFNVGQSSSGSFSRAERSGSINNIQAFLAPGGTYEVVISGSSRVETRLVADDIINHTNTAIVSADVVGGGTVSDSDTASVDIMGSVFEGTDGVDNLTGSGRSDVLIGQEGDDLLIGRAGADVFVIGSTTGQDTIQDFNLAQGDTIGLTSDISYGQLSITQNAGNTEIAFGNDTLAILNGVTTPLTEENFVGYGV
ncbi:MAG: SdrD B-like domain-containing protein, partial [Crocosphaera sp.]